MNTTELIEKVTAIVAEHGELNVLRDMRSTRHDGVSDVFMWVGRNGIKHVVMAGCDEATWMAES